MVTDGNSTYCVDHFTVYTNNESLCCSPETNIILYVNYTSIIKIKVQTIDHYKATLNEMYTE